ncbi:hypothetical protein RHMOL_Rhmol05G0017000 [Rhododendron molle]|uniref:Uncharacterized protein n=1 Tax=Rhododendron molle TaxID=49168 RepID=A0ACC0NKW4_RHOML|nr:hypothetical protein RHMOL_Rhmol05G0017000 [Rhododendron molle]
MALSLVTNLLTSLKPLVEKEVGLLWGVDEEMTKLSSALSAIEAVLEDAERNHPEERAVQDWLRKLKDAAYEVDDILDECSTEILRWESKGQSSGFLEKVGTSLLYPFENIKFRLRIGHMMKEISVKLAAIADERNKFHFRNMTLILDGCEDLKRLPNNMKCLRNLRHLHLSRCSLTEMPPEIGQLTCLKELTLFVVGKNKGCHLAELQHLNLGGVLRIEHLERVKNPMDAKEANLAGKHNLRVLMLCWEYNDEAESQENVEELLEALEPHPNIEKLVIENYYGTHLPRWMMDLKNVDLIELRNCKNCLKLPPIGQLPLLRRLSIWRMDKLNYIDDDLPDGGFPSLEVLKLYHLSSLNGLSRKKGTIKELFPLLHRMEIADCSNFSFRSISSLKTLSVEEHCPNVLLESISTCESLTSLEVSGNEEAICFPEEVLRNLTLLKSLRIERFTKLKSFPNGLAHLKALKSLSINRCDKLKSLPEEGLRGLESLQRLEICCCEEFSSLSEGLQHLVCLESLKILGCPELVALPEGVKHLKSLQRLQMSGGLADVLVALPETLQHVPALQYLSISNYPALTSLPDWLGNLTTLQSLVISNCSKISSLPASIQSLTDLRSLLISESSPELARRCEKGKGEDWDKIAHIPQVDANQKGYNGYMMAASLEKVVASVRMHCWRKLVGCSGNLKINKLE